MRRTLAMAAALALTVMASGGSSATVRPDPPFQTSKKPMLAAVAPGVELTPIINAGELLGTRADGFQFTGTPDGIGVYRSAPNRLEVFINHELSYRYGDTSWSRITHLTLNPAGEIVKADYALDGTLKYEYFCSSTMAMLGGTPWYLTGEEWVGSPKGGVSIALNAETGELMETPQFGALNHENVVPVKQLDDAVVFLSEDSFRYRSQAYSYFAGSFGKALAGDGKFAVWVPNDPGDGDPSANDIAKGEVMKGRFVTIPHIERYSGKEVNELAESLGSFNFIRIEDAAVHRSNPGVVYFADTGALGTDLKRGRVYKMTYNPNAPRHARLEVVLDNGAGDAILNPDGMGISKRALVIQEDHNSSSSRAARILVYNLLSETLTIAARLDTSQDVIDASGPGAWESSGAVDVSAFFGPNMWLVSVQAHKTSVRQQGIDLEIDSGTSEKGQLLLVKIPGT